MKTAPLRILVADADEIERERLLGLLRRIDVAQVCGVAAGAMQTMALNASLQPDVVMIDAELTGMAAIEVARLLMQQSQQSPAPAVVLMSASDRFALQAYDAGVLDYLLKPVRAERLQASLVRMLALRAPQRRTVRHFNVEGKGRHLKVPVDEAVFLRAEQRYVELHTVRGMHLLETSLQEVEESMPDLFLRIHRGVLVARAALAGIERVPGAVDAGGAVRRVILRGSPERLPVSRRQWPQVKAALRAREG